MFCLAGTVKGLLGMGLPLVAIALMSIAVEPKAAVPLVLVSGLVLNLVQFLQMGGVREIARRYSVLALAAAVSVWGGTELLFAVDQQIIEILLGIIVCGYVVINVIRIPPALPRVWEARLAIPVGLLLGVLQARRLPRRAGCRLVAGRLKDEFVASAMSCHIVGPGVSLSPRRVTGVAAFAAWIRGLGMVVRSDPRRVRKRYRTDLRRVPAGWEVRKGLRGGGRPAALSTVRSRPYPSALSGKLPDRIGSMGVASPSFNASRRWRARPAPTPRAAPHAELPSEKGKVAI